MEQKSNENKRYYTNFTELEINGADVNLCINYKENENVEKLCKIIFSPEQAKLTMIMLEKAIAEFESTRREINVNVDAIKRSEGENIDGEEK